VFGPERQSDGAPQGSSITVRSPLLRGDASGAGQVALAREQF